jgi:hypothetical protein
MIRSKLWFTCAAMHDPVSPVVIRPAVIGWEAKYRQVNLTIERTFSGEELVQRMKGWVTVNPIEVIQTVKKHGFLKVFEDNSLVVEMDKEEQFSALEADLKERFDGQVFLEKLPKK